jgi:hypothetical protein
MYRLFLFIALLCFGNAWGQDKPKLKFSSDPKELDKQLEILLAEPNVEVIKQTYITFHEMYAKQGKITDAEMKTISSICNIMDAKKLRPNPHFHNYLKAIIFFKSGKNENSDFEQWHAVLEQLLQKMKVNTNKDFIEYIDFSMAFFESHYLKNTGAKNWKASSEDFELIYDDEPKIVFKNTWLITTGIGDTSIIKNTNIGTWFILQEKWKGDQGKIDWAKAGLDSALVFATFQNYTLDANKPDFILDSVTFMNRSFLTAPVVGKLTDKITSRTNGAFSANYPKFESNQYFELNELGKGIKYKGGFGQIGDKVKGNGMNGRLAEFKFYDSNNKLIIVAQSNSFIIKKGEQISSEFTRVKLVLGDDSIFHPGLEFKYKILNRELKLTRGEMGVSKIPFADSYHKCDIKAEALIWKIDSNKISLDMITGAGLVPATLESHNYFSPNIIEKYTNIADYNPISVIKKYCEKHGVTEVDADVIAQEINPKFDVGTIKRTLYNLTEEGFIYYDEYHNKIIMKEKSVVYVKANRKLIDYDNISLKSNPGSSGVNFTLNTDNKDLKIRGVKSMMLSDSGQIFIFPDRGLVMKQNRDMTFGGAMFGGRADIISKQFDFKYADFKIELNNADSMLINIPTGKLLETGKEELKPTATYICGITGTFKCDAPRNKSSRVLLKEYPALKTTDAAYTFYSDKPTVNGAYKKDIFKFKLDTFLLDSLNHFDVKALGFDGTLISGGIFPDITERISLQSDLSLGFKSKTADEGLSLYNERGNFKGSYSLNNTGLRGKGEFTFMNSVSNASAILFAPDSLNAKVDNFSQSASSDPIAFPEVNNKNVFTHWEPNNDKMFIKMDTTPFNFFGGISKLYGNTMLSSKEMTGNGKMDWNEATLESKLMHFGKLSIKADTASLKVKTTDGSNALAFTAPNLNSTIDFEKRTGDFASNTKEAASTFVYNQFSTSINKFHWDMAQKNMDFISDPNDSAQFISLNNSQFGLNFIGRNAKYDLNNYILNVGGVYKIATGDVWIYPDSGSVTIEPQAVIRPLFNARILCDTNRQYHKIYDATVKINSKYNYLATNAKYDFNSKITGKQIIIVDTLTMMNEGSRWYSSGFSNIKEDQNFTINPKMSFKGYFNFNSKDRDPYLNGFAKLKLRNKYIPTEWFTLNSVMKADSGNFNVIKPKNERGGPLYFGLLKSYYDSTGVYPSIFASPYNSLDKVVFLPEGSLQYNVESNEIFYGDASKIRDEIKKGNYLTYNDATNKLFCEGKFEMGLDYGALKTFVAGNATADLNRNNQIYLWNIAMKMDMDKALFNIMLKEMIDLIPDKEDIDYTSPFFEKAMAELVSERDLKKIMSKVKSVTVEEESTPEKSETDKTEDSNNETEKKVDENIEPATDSVAVDSTSTNNDQDDNSGKKKKKKGKKAKTDEVKDENGGVVDAANKEKEPKEKPDADVVVEATGKKFNFPNSDYNFYFTDVRLTYDNSSNSFKGGGPIGLSHLGQYYMGKKIYGFFEYGGKRNDEFFNVYFETSESDWYYFYYRGHILFMISSNDAFNEAIQKIVPEKRRIQPDKSDTKNWYTYQLGSDVKKKGFVERMKFYQF